MAATQKYQLIVEAQARGEEELLRLERALTRVDDSTKKLRNTTFEIVGSIAATTAAIKAGTASMAAFAQANIAAESGLRQTITGYRSLRLAAASFAGAGALAFTATTIGAVVLAEKIGQISNRYGKLIEQNALLAAQNKQTFESTQTFSTVGTVTGRDLSAFAAFSPDQLRDYISELKKIPDPIDRNRRAVEIFGKDAAAAYDLVGTGITRNLIAAQELTQQLDYPTRTSIQRLRDDFKAFEDFRPFDMAVESLRQFREEARQGITIKTATAVDFLRTLGNRLPKTGDGAGGVEGGVAIDSGERPGLGVPTYDELRRMAPGVIGTSPRFTTDARGDTIPIAPGLPSLVSIGQRRAAVLSANARSSSLESLRSQLAGAQASANIAAAAVQQGGPLAESSSLALLQAEKLILTLENQIKSIEKLKAAEEGLARLRKSVQQDIQFADLTPVQRRQAEAISQFGVGAAAQFNPLLAREQREAIDRVRSGGRTLTAEGVKAAEAGSQQTLEDQTRLFRSSLTRSISNEEDSLTKLRAAIRESNQSDERRVETQAKIVALTTGPGGELAAINKIYELKRAGLEQEIAFGEEIFNLNERRYQIEEERTLSILDLQRQRRDEARGLASDFVGSLQSGRPQDFFRQQGGRLINQIGTNALTGTFQRVQSTLGSIGAASGLGGLLKGTLLDPSNATPIDKNTLATERNTAALERVSVGGFSAGTGSALALPSGFNAIAALGPASGLFGQSAYGKVAQITGGAASALAPGGLFAGARSGSIQLGNGSATTAEGLGLTTTASRTANIAGSTASIGAGALTAYRGFKQGGVAGISQGITAALGTAALIPGPQQPFIAAAAATAALVSMLLPDPKKARDAAINREIQDAYFAENAPMSFSMDRFGRGYDYNKRGDMRGVPVTININALDSRSITDNRESIADAVRMAVYEGHGLNRAMQEAVGAAA